jgi:two-component sensor histidine kinase
MMTDPAAFDLRLMELRHRLANCFHLVNSLIQVRLSRARHPETREHLSWLLDMVTALGLLQRRLSDDHDGDFAPYLEDVAQFWRRVGSANNIDVVTGADPIKVDPQHASALALITHELVTNSMKHAFPNRSSGTIRIELRVEGQRVNFSVSDDGVGPSGAANNDEHNGLKLVHRLADLMGAAVTVTVDNGMRVELSFQPNRE